MSQNQIRDIQTNTEKPQNERENNTSINKLIMTSNVTDDDDDDFVAAQVSTQ